MPENCEHDWQRAPDRDRIYGHHHLPGSQFSLLVFWCRKCLKVETRRADFDAVQRGVQSTEGDER